ncbi:MAG: shikimate kinase [Candidatus Oleimicrobiaceae bacterium]
MPELRDANIYLIGFMGAGKSTVGRALAARLKRPFVDTDEVIEHQTGRTIAHIFAREGERAFRLMEQHLLAELTCTKGQVVAVGGGAVMDDGNWKRLQESGITVYLHCPVALLVRRLAEDGVRPLLQGQKGSRRQAFLAKLFAQREVRYRQAKLILLVEEGKGVGELVDQLIEMLEREHGNA